MWSEPGMWAMDGGEDLMVAEGLAIGLMGDAGEVE
jgi:hypothetical protein